MLISTYLRTAQLKQRVYARRLVANSLTRLFSSNDDKINEDEKIETPTNHSKWQKFELIEQFPWKIGNTKELIKTTEISMQHELETFREQLKENVDGLYDGVYMSFDTLFESIYERDINTIS